MLVRRNVQKATSGDLLEASKPTANVDVPDFAFKEAHDVALSRPAHAGCPARWGVVPWSRRRAPPLFLASPIPVELGH